MYGKKWVIVDSIGQTGAIKKNSDPPPPLQIRKCNSCHILIGGMAGILCLFNIIQSQLFNLVIVNKVLVNQIIVNLVIVNKVLVNQIIVNLVIVNKVLVNKIIVNLVIVNKVLVNQIIVSLVIVNKVLVNQIIVNLVIVNKVLVNQIIVNLVIVNHFLQLFNPLVNIAITLDKSKIYVVHDVSNVKYLRARYQKYISVGTS